MLLCELLFWFVFFFKQKTAYEMRISDWSSDVCSSDLRVPNRFELVLLAAERARQLGRGEPQMIEVAGEPRTLVSLREIAAGKVDVNALRERQIGRASCRERVCQYV